MRINPFVWWKMILIDYSQTAIAGVMVQLSSDPKLRVDEDMIRHIILSTLRSYTKQYKPKYGKLVICYDHNYYWRQEYFPFYKSNRKKSRQNSKFDWNVIFSCMKKIREELRDNYPAKIVGVPYAEADDIIGVLARRYSPSEEVLIISSDKDFLQLQTTKNIQQYSPYLKRFIRTTEPEAFLKQQIITGERGDGIPNMLSPDNTYAIGARNKRISKENLTTWIKQDPKDFCVNDTMVRNYERNKTLIDLKCTPSKIQEAIVESYDSAKTNSRMDFFEYLVKNQLKALAEVADDF